MDPITFSGMYEAIKAVACLAKVAADAAVDHKVKEAIFKLQQGLYDLQAKALEDQQGRMTMLSQVDTLQKELDAIKDRRARLDLYELIKLEPGSFVYRSKDQAGVGPQHCACPNCFVQFERIAVLQVEAEVYGTTRYRCMSCQFEIFAGFQRDPPPIEYGRAPF